MYIYMYIYIYIYIYIHSGLYQSWSRSLCAEILRGLLVRSVEAGGGTFHENGIPALGASNLEAGQALFLNVGYIYIYIYTHRYM